jgi:hypothetical protein
MSSGGLEPPDLLYTDCYGSCNCGERVAEVLHEKTYSPPLCAGYRGAELWSFRREEFEKTRAEENIHGVSGPISIYGVDESRVEQRTQMMGLQTRVLGWIRTTYSSLRIEHPAPVVGSELPNTPRRLLLFTL